MRRGISTVAFGSRVRAAATAAVVTAVAVGGVALAEAGSDDVITACASNSTGVLRLLAAGETCKSSESAVDWNRTGPTGPQGPAGATGPQGPVGPQGPPGVSGVRTVQIPVPFAQSSGGGIETANASASCGAGERALSGGYTVSGAEVTQSRPSDDTTGWRWTFVPKPKTSAVSATAWMVCANVATTSGGTTPSPTPSPGT